MLISVIISTHNRSAFLKEALNAFVDITDTSHYEIIVVDNNSDDNTKNISKKCSVKVKYVFEPNTSFTKARNTGVKNSRGDILLFMDDDTLIKNGSLDKISKIFFDQKKCGMIAGRVIPKFTQKPSNWVLKCQRSFNGWSLFNSSNQSEITKELQEVSHAVGPMMAIRRSIYEQVGGFPPDTVGVETNSTPGSFSKWYIGPGDFGLSINVLKAGYKIIYFSKICASHVISPVRFTIQFWRSRMIGEGYCEAISQRGFYNLSPYKSLKKRYEFKKKLMLRQKSILKRLQKKKAVRGKGISEDELWLWYYKAYLDMDSVLRKYPKLWSILWEIGKNGVSNDQYRKITDLLPEEYFKLVDKRYIFNGEPIVFINDYRQIIEKDTFIKSYLSLHEKISTEAMLEVMNLIGKIR